MSTSTLRRLARTSVAVLSTVGAAVGVTVGVAGSAGAADTGDTGDTATTFTLTGGALSISAPQTADLGSATVASPTVSGQLGNVTVDDTRGSLVANWTAKVSATDFTTGAGSPAETITKDGLAYVAGAAVSSTGTGAFAPGVSGPLGLQLTAYSHVGTGVNSVTWNPSVTITVPVGKVAGTYTGTITHSVS